MARGRVYVPSGGVPMTRLAGPYYYSVEDYAEGNMMLTLYSHERMSAALPVLRETLYLVEIDQSGSPTLTKMNAPSDNQSLLMWLLSYKRDYRKFGLAAYQQLVGQRRTMDKKLHGLKARVLEGDGYRFYMCLDDQDKNKIYRVAAYVDAARQVKPETASEILMQWPCALGFPRAYVAQILRKRFQLSEDMLEQIEKINPVLFSREYRWGLNVDETGE